MPKKKRRSVPTKEEAWKWLASRYPDPKQFDQDSKRAWKITHGKCIRRPGRPDDLGLKCFEAIEKGLTAQRAFKTTTDQSDPYSLGMVPVRKVQSKGKTWAIVAQPHERVPLSALIEMIEQRIPISRGAARKWAKEWELNNVPNAQAMTLADRVAVAKTYKQRVPKM